MSEMRNAMRSQPEQLARLLADAGAAEACAARLAGRRLLLVGVGTSWHAAQHGGWMLREAGVDVEAAHAADLAPYARRRSPRRSAPGSARSTPSPTASPRSWTGPAR